MITKYYNMNRDKIDTLANYIDTYELNRSVKHIDLVDNDNHEYTPRDYQNQIVDKVKKFIHKTQSSTKKKVIVLNLPTGSGKSLIGVYLIKELLASGNYFISSDKKCYILTHQNNLSLQYLKSFNFLSRLKGKGTYSCELSGVPCTDFDPCNYIDSLKSGMKFIEDSSSPYNKCLSCEYRRDRIRARLSNILLSNYNFYLYDFDNEIKDHVNMLLLDECHTIFEKLDGILNPDLTKLDEWIRYHFNDFKQSLKDGMEYIHNIRSRYTGNIIGEKCHEIYTSLSGSYNHMDSPTYESSRLYYLIHTKKDYLDAKILISRCFGLELFDPSNYSTDSKYYPPELTGKDKARLDKLTAKINKLSHTDKKILETLTIKPSFALMGKVKNDFIKLYGNDLYLWNIINEIGIDKTLDRVHLVRAAVKALFMDNSQITIMMSATIDDNLVRKYYLDPTQYDYLYLNMDPLFPKEHRPIHMYPRLPILNYKTIKDEKTNRILSEVIYGIISNNAYVDKSGFIYTSSFTHAKVLYELLKRYHPDVMDRIILNDSSINTKACISEFVAHVSPNKILLSPNIKEGYDLKDDLSRLQIIAKIPYPTLDILTGFDEEYYCRSTVTSLLQIYGRSIRSMDDWADTYILDNGLLRLKKFLPQWFLDSIITH